tara:strand:+ start:321 stop:737 length:417 start_codon:yes stop_codon:yes gene_type:complete
MEYDNTNRGAAHPPFETQHLILTGKLDIEGNSKNIALVKDTDKNGEPVIVVYQRMGCMYANDNIDGDKPNYSGPLDNNKRVAAWKKQSEKGVDYLSLKCTDKRSGLVPSTSYPAAPAPVEPVVSLPNGEEIRREDIPF